MSIMSVSNKATANITNTIVSPGLLITDNTSASDNTAVCSNAACSAETTDGAAHNGREARNLAEKQRRDKLNASIHELSTMVPHVAESTRRLDKTAVLRFAAHGFRLQHVFGKSAVQRKLQQQQDEMQPQLGEVLMQLLDSFLITLTCHGQIVLISETVEQLLGHCRLDLYGQNILNIIHPEDQAFIQQQLVPRDLENMFSHKFTCNNSTNQQLTEQHENAVQQEQQDNDISDDESVAIDGWAFQRSKALRQRLKDIDKRLRKDKRSFTVRVARASTRSETTRNYEIVKFDGCFRRSDHSANEQGNSFPIVAQIIRRSRSANSGVTCGVVGSGTHATSVNYMQHDAIAQAALHGVSGNDIVFVGMARIVRPPKLNIYPLNNNTLEYRTRHLIDGRIVDCDQRIGLVAGYMKDEVKNLSPFSFMHQDDVRWVIVALRQMYDRNSNYGESCYRLLTRNGNFIYLQSKGYMEIDKHTNKVHSFVCINTLLDEEEGKQRVKAMKNKFSVIIQTKIPSNSLQDVPASQNPQQLERIVLYLIENLQKRNENAAVINEQEDDAIPSVSRTPTQPLALVPPEASSVRTSISRSVSVVQQQYSAKSPSCCSHFGSSEASLSPASTTTEHNDELLHMEVQPITPRTSVLQMKHAIGTTNNILSPPACSTSPSAADMPPDAAQQLQQELTVLKRLRDTNTTSTSPVKRMYTLSESPPASMPAVAPKEIHDVLTHSWRHLDQSLDTIGQKAQSLKSRPASHSIDRQLDELMVEHDMQQEMLVHIKHEYDTHLQQNYQPQQQQEQQTQLQLTHFDSDGRTLSPRKGVNTSNTLTLGHM